MEKLLLSNHTNSYVIKNNDILYIEGMGAYTLFVFKNGESIKTSKSIGHYEYIFENKLFYRLAKGLVLNIDEIHRVVKDRKNNSKVVFNNGSEYDLKYDIALRLMVYLVNELKK